MTDQDKPAFATAMAQLCIGLREPDPDAAQMRTYFIALRDLETEFVIAAVDLLVKESKFFPKPSEWREAAHRIERDRREDLQRRLDGRRHRGLPPICAACDDTGFAPIAENRVKPCDCRVLRRLEVLGRRPMPALPPAPEESTRTDAEVLADVLEHRR